jgi:O-antigen biosynthesis protein
MSRTPSGRTSGKVRPADTSAHPAADATEPSPAARGGSRREAAAAPAPATPVASQIEVDIDPTVSSGPIFDRFDLLMHGRAVASTPVEEIALKLDDAVIGRVEFGAMDSAVQGGLPEDGNRTQYVFYLNVPLRRAEAQRRCACILAVRTSDGHIHEEAFELAVDPSSATPVTVLTGKTHPTAAYAHIRPPIVLYVERAALDDRGHVQLGGWAISRTAMIAIQAFVGDQKLAPAQLGQRRDDVGSTFPAYANARLAGFTLNSDIVAGSDQDLSTVRVQAISRDGFTHEVVVPLEHVRNLATPGPAQRSTATDAPAAAYPAAAGFQIGTDLAALVGEPVLVAPPAPVVEQRRPSDPRREIRYFCDNMDLQPEGRLSAVGWAVCAIGISAVTVYLDGEAIGDAELGLLREDVGNEHRHIPMARYAGFRFVRNLPDLPAGEHEIRVVMRNGLDDEQCEVRTVLIERAEPSQPPPESSSPSQFRLEIDTPAIVSSVAVEPITGRLTIEGWALARSGVSGIEVMLDDQRLGDAHYGLARQDVGIAFPDWVDSLRSGFAFHCPPRALRNGDHVIQLNVRGRAGELLEYRFNITIRKSEEFDEGMSIRRRMTQVERDVAEDVLASLSHRPGFRLVLPLPSEPDPDQFLATLASLRAQTYRDWRLDVLPSDATIGDAVRALIEQGAEDLAERIDVLDPSDQASFGQPIGNLQTATPGRLVGFIGAGDELGCDALLQIAIASGLHRDADMLYADEVKLSQASREREPYFKPDFSPDLLLSTNYIGHPWFASTALLGRSGLTPAELLAKGEYDAVLRCTEQADSIHHVPRLLCARGSQWIDDEAMETAALTRAAARRGIAAEIVAGAVPGTWRFRRTETVTGMVSIIIPTCAARGYIEACIRSLRERTAYRNFEIICVDNIPDNQVAWKLWLKQNADKIVPMPDEFNWSHFNNVGVAAASGEYLLFLNDDIEVIQPDWLDVMLEHVNRPEVAVVGPQLLYPDNKVQHAGMFLATPGIARHAFRFAPSDDPGYFGLALTQRNVIAVTGACMLMRRGIHQALGGFEEAHQIINNDLDFCLRAHQGGKLIVYTPYASLMHYEAASRDRLKDVFDLGHFEERWKSIFAGGDPYFSPRLTRYSDDYRPDDEPVETIYAGHPLFHHDDIKRILVVKVDHIGDFVTAIPAIRRLKEIFPAASIHVLASRAARAFAETEDCIDEFIEFEFFHTVSGLGPKDISEEEYQALREQLTPYRFDIAVDLRKHLDTRDVLRYTPARYLVGYDYMGQYPYLDIALEWEGDKSLQRKRSHVTDDLVNLVEAIGTAGTSGRTRLVMGGPVGGIPDFLPPEARALFVKPVVAVHPGVGNVMRQWPAEHFAALIDLMMEKNGVNIVLIGGNEEAELADEVLAQVLRRDSVVSLVGKTSLRQLPELLRACAIYIGNNSGPKHIAAALGVPTIGLHSGVVDAIEWGPIGQRAVALRRNMTCSPCYLSRLEDCPRNFACMRGLEPTSVQEVAEVFLARPVERKLGTPLVEPDPEIVALPPKASRARKASSEAPAERPDAPDEAAPRPAKQAPAREAKPKRKRSGARQGSPASAES